MGRSLVRFAAPVHGFGELGCRDDCLFCAGGEESDLIYGKEALDGGVVVCSGFGGLWYGEACEPEMAAEFEPCKGCFFDVEDV